MDIPIIAAAVIASWFAGWSKAPSPTPDHLEIASAIEAVAATEEEARDLSAIAIRESGVRVNPCTIGPCDHLHSHGWAQLYGAPDTLDHDALETARRAVVILRRSKAMCPAFRFAAYARGTFGCIRQDAQRISRDRERLSASFVLP